MLNSFFSGSHYFNWSSPLNLSFKVNVFHDLNRLYEWVDNGMNGQGLRVSGELGWILSPGTVKWKNLKCKVPWTRSESRWDAKSINLGILAPSLEKEICRESPFGEEVSIPGLRQDDHWNWAGGAGHRLPRCFWVSSVFLMPRSFRRNQPQTCNPWLVVVWLPTIF